MSKIELTLSPTYVPTWTCVDAMRELFQNALDQEAQNSANVAAWDYDNGTFTICNAASTLTAKSLLLGQTTKLDDGSTIGKFGEGYKIATLVLLREGKTVTFYNYGAKEIWRPRFVKSRKFGTDILTFFIEKAENFWHKAPSADLIITVEGITPEEHAAIVESNLHLRDDYTVLERTMHGDVINLPGKVFVNGLYVCDYEPYMYGYNFKPDAIRLDRDRKMVNDFDLRWMASKMWSSSGAVEKVLEMVAEGRADVAYLDNVSYPNIWRDLAADKFMSVYGPEAVPVTTQQELDLVPAGRKGVVVSEGYNALIRGSSVFVMPEYDAASPLEELQDWFDRVKRKLDSEEIKQFEAIMEVLHG